MPTESSQRVSAAWGNWKRCSGVLCDSRETEGKPLQTVVGAALLYGTETWATTRGQEARLDVNKNGMLRWMCGVTSRDTIRNEHIGWTTRLVKKKRETKPIRWKDACMRDMTTTHGGTR